MFHGRMVHFIWTPYWEPLYISAGKIWADETGNPGHVSFIVLVCLLETTCSVSVFIKRRWRLCGKCNFKTQHLMGLNRKQYTIICRADGEPGFNLYEGMQCCANEEGCTIALMVIYSLFFHIILISTADGRFADVYHVIVQQIYSSRAFSWYVCLVALGKKSAKSRNICQHCFVYFFCALEFLSCFLLFAACEMPSNIQNLFFSFKTEEDNLNQIQTNNYWQNVIAKIHVYKNERRKKNNRPFSGRFRCVSINIETVQTETGNGK